MNDINILIIEDEQGISKIIKSYLEKFLAKILLKRLETSLMFLLSWLLPK